MGSVIESFESANEVYRAMKSPGGRLFRPINAATMGGISSVCVSHGDSHIKLGTCATAQTTEIPA